VSLCAPERRDECAPMSMMATGPPPSRRPGLTSRSLESGLLRSFAKGLGRLGFERFSTSRQARICHEGAMRVERGLALLRPDAYRAAIGHFGPALLVVGEVRHHDLVEDLFMHRPIENRHNRFDTAVEDAE